MVAYAEDYEQVADSYSDVHDEAPVYRSVAHLFNDDDDLLRQHVVGMRFDDPCWSYTSRGACELEAAARFAFELPHEVFAVVLSFLPSHPDLFNAMAVSRHWCQAARETHAGRIAHVPPLEDALMRAAAAATPGDTLLLQPGHHWLSSELLIEKPLRVGAANAGSPTVLVSRAAALVRTRATVELNGLTFCRLGDAEAHPNAVIVAESAALSMSHCRLTCGGSAPSVEHALLAFVGAPPPGGAWEVPPAPELLAADASHTRQGPQLGVWVGMSAVATLRHNTIACCGGPGVKVYNGKLLAEDNTIAFSRCGANVVANSGRVEMRRNAVHGANGDGMAMWNHSNLALEHNTISGNGGAGVTVNGGAGSVTIARNRFVANTLAAVQFTTSNAKKVTIGVGDQANDWTQNAAGGLIGLAPFAVPSPAASIVHRGASSSLSAAGTERAGAASSSAPPDEDMDVDYSENSVESADGGSARHGRSSMLSANSARSAWSVEMG